MTGKSINGTLDGRQNQTGGQRDFTKRYFTKITVKTYNTNNAPESQSSHSAHQVALESKQFIVANKKQVNYK